MPGNQRNTCTSEPDSPKPPHWAPAVTAGFPCRSVLRIQNRTSNYRTLLSHPEICYLHPPCPHTRRNPQNLVQSFANKHHHHKKYLDSFIKEKMHTGALAPEPTSCPSPFYCKGRTQVKIMNTHPAARVALRKWNAMQTALIPLGGC